MVSSRPKMVPSNGLWWNTEPMEHMLPSSGYSSHKLHHDFVCLDVENCKAESRRFTFFDNRGVAPFGPRDRINSPFSIWVSPRRFAILTFGEDSKRKQGTLRFYCCLTHDYNILANRTTCWRVKENKTTYDYAPQFERWISLNDAERVGYAMNEDPCTGYEGKIQHYASSFQKAPEASGSARPKQDVVHLTHRSTTSSSRTKPSMQPKLAPLEHPSIKSWNSQSLLPGVMQFLKSMITDMKCKRCERKFTPSRSNMPLQLTRPVVTSQLIRREHCV